MAKPILLGFIGGFCVAALLALSLRGWELSIRRSQEPEQRLDALKAENRALRSRMEELERRVVHAETPAKPAPAPEPKPAEDTAAEAKPAAEKPDLGKKLEAIVDKGLAAYKSKDFLDLAKLIKENKAEGLALLRNALLKGKTSQERFMAAALMEEVGDAEAIPALAEALTGDDDDLVRRMASHAIAMIGTGAAEAPLRGAMTGDKDWGVRVNSAYGVAKLGKDDGLRMLTDAYSSSETPPEYRLGILGGLADVAAPTTAPLFRRILADTKDMGYQLIAIGALVKMKDAASRPDLERLAASEAHPKSVREAAQKALVELGK